MPQASLALLHRFSTTQKSLCAGIRSVISMKAKQKAAWEGRFAENHGRTVPGGSKVMPEPQIRIAWARVSSPEYSLEYSSMMLRIGSW